MARIDRPKIPTAYGVSKAIAYVDWSHVERRLATDSVFWIATAGRSGQPRVRPVDGLYLDGAIYVGGNPETGWVRDVIANSAVSVHLDGTGDVIIIEGEAALQMHIDDALAARLSAASMAKFPESRLTPEIHKARGAIAIRPRRVISWTDIAKDPTRFSFEPW